MTMGWLCGAANIIVLCHLATRMVSEFRNTVLTSIDSKCVPPSVFTHAQPDPLT